MFVRLIEHYINFQNAFTCLRKFNSPLQNDNKYLTVLSYVSSAEYELLLAFFIDFLNIIFHRSLKLWYQNKNKSDFFCEFLEKLEDSFNLT